jgi:hypothetical protein
MRHQVFDGDHKTPKILEDMMTKCQTYARLKRWTT